MAISIALAPGSLIGCSALRGGDPEPTISADQAIERVDSVLDDTFKAVHPQLKWRDGPAHLSEIKSSFTNTASGEVSVGRHRFVRTKISKAKLNKLIAAFDKQWRKAGFEIKSTNPREPSLSGKASDGCVVNFSVSGFGNVEISAGVAARSDGPRGGIEGEGGDTFPKAPDGGPDYTPDAQDPYWSA
ncbi:hypothetical protein ACFC0M_14385 [Streptomyces sp. NPDC056149]|uniref:hypothetical protein n=1 Tax=Streptomyces sp. NPDC056149 TaxID=3345728 RepID=UPI0035E181DC